MNAFITNINILIFPVNIRLLFNHDGMLDMKGMSKANIIIVIEIKLRGKKYSEKHDNVNTPKHKTISLSVILKSLNRAKAIPNKNTGK